MDTDNTADETFFDDEIVPTDEDGAEQGSTTKIKDLREKIKALEAEKTEYLTGWQRARADYANLQKTHDEDKKRLKAIFKEGFIADLIPVVDSFQMAMANKEAWEKVDANWRTGVEYIYSQLMTALENHGLTVFGEAGETFDPARYEAVSEEGTDDAAKDHTVAKVIQKGFSIGENVIRPARVVVYKMI